MAYGVLELPLLRKIAAVLSRSATRRLDGLHLLEQEFEPIQLADDLRLQTFAAKLGAPLLAIDPLVSTASWRVAANGRNRGTGFAGRF